MKQHAASPRQVFKAFREALRDKLEGANITFEVSGKKETTGYTESYTAKFKSGKSVGASRVAKSSAMFPEYLYTTDIGGKTFTTDTELSKCNGYGAEAKLIYLDLKKAYKSNQALQVAEAIKGLAGER